MIVRECNVYNSGKSSRVDLQVPKRLIGNLDCDVCDLFQEAFGKKWERMIFDFQMGGIPGHRTFVLPRDGNSEMLKKFIDSIHDHQKIST